MRPFVVFIAAIFLASSLVGAPLEYIQGYLFLVVLVFVGIPHGALDHKLIFSQNGYIRAAKIKFYLTYLSLMTLTAVLWYSNPKWSFISFIGLSAYHFGQSQLYYINLPQILKHLFYTAWGAFLLSLIILFNLNECLDFFLSLKSLEASAYMTKHIVINISLISGAVTFILFGYASFSKRLNALDLMYEIISIALFLSLAVSTTAVLTFILYFGLWHSLVSLNLEYKFLQSRNNGLKFWSFVRELAPHSLVAIAFMGVLYWLSNSYQWEISPYVLFIILISIITVPHLFVMSRLYHFFSLKSS